MWKLYFKVSGEVRSIVCHFVRYRSSVMKVVLSEHNLQTEEGFEQVFNVSRIFVHNFKYKTFDNDIMLIKVSSQNNAWNP